MIYYEATYIDIHNMSLTYIIKADSEIKTNILV